MTLENYRKNKQKEANILREFFIISFLFCFYKYKELDPFWKIYCTAMTTMEFTPYVPVLLHFLEYYWIFINLNKFQDAPTEQTLNIY